MTHRMSNRRKQSHGEIFEAGGVRTMTQWKCSNCGYMFGADALPDRCPSCKQACTFSDVTCYIPECGGPQNADPRLTGKKDRSSNE
jgi:rubredoxin